MFHSSYIFRSPQTLYISWYLRSPNAFFFFPSSHAFLACRCMSHAVHTATERLMPEAQCLAMAPWRHRAWWSHGVFFAPKSGGYFTNMGMKYDEIWQCVKIAGKWMFIPLKMILIDIDPYPYDEIWWTDMKRTSLWVSCYFMLFIVMINGNIRGNTHGKLMKVGIFRWI